MSYQEALAEQRIARAHRERQEGVVEGIAVGGHAVGRGDGAQRADVVVGARITHHTHRANG